MDDRDTTYTHGHHESVLRSHRARTIANSAAYLEPHLVPGLHLLDVGCGPATITVEMAERVAPGTVMGIDAAADAIEVARTEVERRGIANVELCVGDVYDIDVADDTFDVVHAHQVLQHVTDPVAALREMRRVARPGGLVAARDSDYAAFFWYPELDGLTRWMEVYQAVARANRAEPDAGRRLLAWAREAGFTDVTPSASIWCFATPEDRQWWGGMWAERVTASAFAEQALAGAHATAGELDHIADAWREWADCDDGWLTVPHGEVLAVA